jgi:hypothetical protein
MNDLKIIVTERHIRKAHKGLCGHCPVAVAIKEAGKSLGVGNVIVDRATIRFTEEGTRYIFATPNLAQTFLHTFDEYFSRPAADLDTFIGAFKPFSFWLRNLRAMQITPSKPAERKGKRKRIRVIKDKRKKSKTRKPRVMVAAPTIIGGIPIATLGSRKRIHGIRAFAEASSQLFPAGLPEEQPA